MTRQRQYAVVDSKKVQGFDQERRSPTAMQPAISPEQRQAAKRQMIEQIEQRASVQQARSKFLPDVMPPVAVTQGFWVAHESANQRGHREDLLQTLREARITESRTEKR